MCRLTWDETFIQMADLVALRSKDQSSKLGAVIIGPDKEVRSTGYNCFPRGVNDNNPERQKRPLKYLWVEHAERNAIYNATRMGLSLKNCIIYSDWIPCCDCARAIIQVGISEVVIRDEDVPDRWVDNFYQSLLMFKESNIKIRKINIEKNLIDYLIELLSNKKKED